MRLTESGFLICTTIALAACSNVPERKVEGRSSPMPAVGAQSARPEPGALKTSPAVSQTAPDEPVVLKSAPSVQQPGSGAYLEGDGPGANAPANLEATPDAVPQSEPLHRYANRQYAVLGKSYTPLTAPGNYKKRGIASWYGKKFHGQRTSSGEKYDMYAMTAAHPTLPIPSYARVTHVASNKSVVVRINDRGPFLHGRIIDLSYTAAQKLGIVAKGSSEVEVESLMPDSIISAPTIDEPVNVEPLETAPVTGTPASGGNVYLQIGAFKSQQGAEGFLARMQLELEGIGKQLSLHEKDGLTRVHLGPYASADEAHANAEKLQGRLGFKPLVNVH